MISFYKYEAHNYVHVFLQVGEMSAHIESQEVSLAQSNTETLQLKQESQALKQVSAITLLLPV